MNVFWFRRDLRVDDNRAFFESLNSNSEVLPIFIFDKNIFNRIFIDSLLFWSFFFSFLGPVLFDYILRGLIRCELLSTKPFSSRNIKKSLSKFFS